MNSGTSRSRSDEVLPRSAPQPFPSARVERVRLLAVGDVHLGRTPSGLPPGEEPRPFGPVAALGDVVERALKERVDAVLFAGDLVDGEHDYFEAYQPLKDAAQRLCGAGIEVICICGNHDVEVLPRLVSEVGGVRLLGEGGRWETHVIRRNGVPVARILGWSFPSAHIKESPLANFDPALLEDGPHGVPTIGLLHADLDAPGSPYAPVPRRDLELVGAVDGWLLGHVHVPSMLTGPRPIGYLGSLSALDPGAPGCHGPWLCGDSDGGLVLEQLPLPRLRFERVDLDIGSAQSEEQLQKRILGAVRDTGERALQLAREYDGGGARRIGVRVRMCGRSPLRRPVREKVRKQALDGLSRPADAGVYLEGLIDAALMRVDLDALARNSDPLGLVARRVLDLESENEHGRRLVKLALARIRERAEHSTFSMVLGEVTLRAQDARALLLEAGRRTLEELLEQKSEVLEGIGLAEGPAPEAHWEAAEKALVLEEETGSGMG